MSGRAARVKSGVVKGGREGLVNLSSTHNGNTADSPRLELLNIQTCVPLLLQALFIRVKDVAGNMNGFECFLAYGF